MAKTMDRVSLVRGGARRPIDWRKRMSDNVAFALLIYTGLQIFVTMGALKTGQGSVLPYFGLVILVGAIIPGCRMFERRWERLSETESANPAHLGSFRRDQLLLWSAAIGLPFLLTGLFKAASHLI